MTSLHNFCRDLQSELDYIDTNTKTRFKHRERDILNQISKIIKSTRKDMQELEIIWLEHYGNNNKPTCGNIWKITGEKLEQLSRSYVIVLDDLEKLQIPGEFQTANKFRSKAVMNITKLNQENKQKFSHLF